MDQRKKLGGRPRKNPRPVEGERVHLGFRVTPSLKNRIEEAAMASGRSQSQEAELRLENSFGREALLPDVLALTYGERMAGLLIAAASVMAKTGRHVAFYRGTQNRWLDDPVAYDRAIEALRLFLESARPEGDAGDIGEPFGGKLKLEIKTPDGKPVALEDHLSDLPASVVRRMIQTLRGSKASFAAAFKEDADKASPILGKELIGRLKPPTLEKDHGNE